MNFSNLSILFIGTEHSDLALFAYNQGAKVFVLSNPVASQLTQTDIVLVRDDVAGWDDDWIPFRRCQGKARIDLVVSCQIDKAKYFIQIAPKLLCPDNKITGLNKHYKTIKPVEEGLLLCN